MLYSTRYTIHPALREFVKGVKIIHIDFDGNDPPSPVYTHMPGYTRFLCFYLRDPVRVRKEAGGFVTRPAAIMAGPQTRPATLELGRTHHVVYVGFKPGAMYRFLGIPMDKLVNEDFDARALLGREVELVVDRLLEAKTNCEQNSIIQQYLLQRLPLLKPVLPFDAAIQELVNAGGNLTMDYVAAQSCLSLRQFERLSNTRLGLPPKLYARVARFFEAFKLKSRFPDLTWTEISNRCGYFDQMHLIRDFKQFSGSTPGMRGRDKCPAFSLQRA
jgi:AraC-like DNA-binding protein